MKKVVILGCENSHADAYLEVFFKTKKDEFADIQVLGVYSDEREAAEKLNQKYGVYVMDSYGEFAGQVDGVIITARHGDDHYKFAKPYLDSGVPMLVDKPITIDEGEAVEFMRTLQAKGAKVCGGSSVKHAFQIQTLKRAEQEQEGGATVGGIVRAPLESSKTQYGGFFFYAEHLIDMVCEIFGWYPKAVEVRFDEKKNRTVLFYYDTFNVIGLYSEGGYAYFVGRFAKMDNQGGHLPSASKRLYYREVKEFVDIMNGAEQPMSYSDFIAPVFIMNAINRASESGKREEITYVQV